VLLLKIGLEGQRKISKSMFNSLTPRAMQGHDRIWVEEE